MKKWLVCGGLTLAACGAAFLFQPDEASALSGEAFEITGSGKILHYHGPPQVGAKTFVNKAKAADIASCIAGNEPSCAGLIEEDAGGKAYVFFDSPTQWRVATNTTGANATTLTGFVGGKGEFVMTGTHALSSTVFILEGKVKFQKGSLTVKKMTGKLAAVSSLAEHYGQFKVKTVGKVLPTKK
jgi:hypothetical protein